jgi:hypothetical protein
MGQLVYGCLSLGLLLASGCSSDPHADFASSEAEDFGTVVFELSSIPAGIGCVRVAVAGTSSVSKDFTLSVGASSASLNMDRLPLGAVAINGAAYAGSCGTGTALYLADVVSAVIETGVQTTLPLTFRKNNAVTAEVNFVGNIQALSLGHADSALVVDGQVYLWGDLNGAATPTLVSGLSEVVDLEFASSSSGTTACALKKDGTVWCWGDNDVFQAGLSSPSTLASPTLALAGESGYTALAGGGAHFCGARAAAKEVKCWGSNSKGQLGNNSTTNSASPVTIYPGSASALGLGLSHTCFGSGLSLEASCAGYNSSYQLGDGTLTTRLTPVSNGVEPVRSLGAGTYHTCASLVDGTARCWGVNGNGQVGDNTTTTRTTPVAVPGLTGVASLDAGYSYTCALLDSGTMKCWGANQYGQLADATTTDRLTPVAVQGLPEPVESFAAGPYHACAVTESHNLYCWGYNFHGQLGDGTYVSATKPVKVRLP